MYGYIETEKIFRIKALYTAFDSKFHNSYYFKGETHNFWEIVIVTEGKIGVTAGSDIFILQKGQMVIHEPMEFHRIWSEENSSPSIIIFSFSAANMPRLSSKFFEVSDISVAKKILHNIRETFIVNGMNVTGIKDNKSVNYQLGVKKLESFILSTISEKVITDNMSISKSARNYSNIVLALESNIDKNLSVSDIAKICKMSEINLKKTFSKYAGIGVMTYFNNLKIRSAVEMLKKGMSVKEVSTALDFSNQNYFSTVFKKITGCSPSYFKE